MIGQENLKVNKDFSILKTVAEFLEFTVKLQFSESPDIYHSELLTKIPSLSKPSS